MPLFVLVVNRPQRMQVQRQLKRRQEKRGRAGLAPPGGPTLYLCSGHCDWGRRCSCQGTFARGLLMRSALVTQVASITGRLRGLAAGIHCKRPRYRRIIGERPSARRPLKSASISCCCYSIAKLDANGF